MPKRRYSSKSRPAEHAHDPPQLVPETAGNDEGEDLVPWDGEPALGGRVLKGPAVTGASLLSLRSTPLQYHHMLCAAGYCAVVEKYLFEINEDGAPVWMLLLPVVAAFHAFLVLLTIWSSRVGVFFQFAKVDDIARATHVIITEKDGTALICPVLKDEHGYACVKQKRKILWHDSSRTFHKLDFPVDHPFKFYIASRGHNKSSLTPALRKFGRNKLDIPLPTWQDLYKEHAVQPFFVFQLFCVLLWMMDEYWQYPLLTAVLLLALEYVVVQTRLANLSSLREMAPPEQPVNVYRHGKWTKIGHFDLVPGDLVSFARREEEFAAPCDMLLVSGSCIVTEAMLTGESTPQMKESIADADPETFLSVRSHSLHIVNGGTTIVQTAPDKVRGGSGMLSPDGGCVGYVLRTQFETKQGKLMRTILYSSDRTSANNKETLGFIAFMLVFAVTASGYVLYHGLADASRSRYKLALNCVMILTSVVPPELPMELTLAVNNSLKTLRLVGVYCTEPFRIPFAGKVDICCFDKTGTLTENEIRMIGVAGFGPAPNLVRPMDISDEATFVLAGCHSVVHVDGQQVGDSTELAALKGINWACTKGDTAIATRGLRKGQKIHVIKRFHFSSEIKRMSCIISLDHERETTLLAVAKGAPEVMEQFYTEVPEWYSSTYQYYSRRGMRVLALGFKAVEDRPSIELHTLTRDVVECNLVFSGFVVLESVLKSESLDTIQSIQAAGHETVMITGDNILTASEVARNLGMVASDKQMLRYDADEDCWRSIDRSMRIDHTATVFSAEFFDEYELGIDGAGVEHLLMDTGTLPKVRPSKYVPRVKVWARCSPKQKECIVKQLGQLGYTTLMCGDGTNDVGALKKAHVGVALLNVEDTAQKLPASLEVKAAARPTTIRSRKPKSHKQRLKEKENQAKQAPGKLGGGVRVVSLMDQLKDETGLVKLGDASIASPFTAKSNTIVPVKVILRQGRCTLVTTYQMLSILGVNSLISAYFLSVMFLDGVKIGDSQAFLPSLFTAACFMCISLAKPLEVLSDKRPHRSLFCVEHLFSIVGQSVIHLGFMLYVVTQAKEMELASWVETDLTTPTLHTEFEPSLPNTGAFILAWSMQVATFAVNYRGHPFTESLLENTNLLMCLCVGMTAVMLAAMDVIPYFNGYLELAPMPTSFRVMLQVVIIADFMTTFLWQRACAMVFW